MGRLELPIADYIGDTKSALDNSVRVLQVWAAPRLRWQRLCLLTMGHFRTTSYVWWCPNTSLPCLVVHEHDAVSLPALCLLLHFFAGWYGGRDGEVKKAL